MRVVVASDKFRGSLTASQVGDSLARGMRRANPRINVEVFPVADGGEGTLDAALRAGFVRRTLTVSGPTGEPVQASFALRDTEAVIEMAAASGLDLLPGGRLEPLRATSFGTGELVRAALDAGCRRIIIGAGGSACTDGGSGLLSALGARLTDAEGNAIPLGGGALNQLHRLELSGLDPRIASTEFILASDVSNSLLGPNGAAAVFAPQKGADAQGVSQLEANLGHWNSVVSKALDADPAALASRAGSGAAGGLGYAVLNLLKAGHRSGVAVILELTKLADRLADADLVITGEGSLDGQSLRGKTPLGVLALARQLGVPAVAVCGRTTLSNQEILAAGFEGAFALTDLEPDVATCMSDAARLLEHVGERVAERMALRGPAPARD